MRQINRNFSFFHPAVDLFFFTVVIAISFFSLQPIFLLISFFSSLLFCVLLKGLRGVITTLLMILPIAAFSTLINPLFVHQGVTVLFTAFGQPITLESVVFGIHAALMLCCVVLWFSCLNCVITAEKITYLFGKAIPAVSLVLSMSIRFVPMYLRQFKQVMLAQKGLQTKKQGAFAKAKTVVRGLSILTTWALEHSIETSDSMRARGYGLPKRTYFSHYRFTVFDTLFLSATALLAGLVITGCCLGENQMLFYPKLVYCPITWFSILVYFAYAVLTCLPSILLIREELKWKSYSAKM